uniref:Uncharacterized protein n=1 Tax=Ananas comosus var. bracteatus TaxID=296719 RepID=A0A6V7P9K2_ANACO|nr:unnamed protein product [Ananas comosus var. bracteatus]
MIWIVFSSYSTLPLPLHHPVADAEDGDAVLLGIVKKAIGEGGGHYGAVIVADRPVHDTFCVLNKDGTGISYGLLFAFGQLHDFFRKINPEHRPISSLTGDIEGERD